MKFSNEIKEEWKLNSIESGQWSDTDHYWFEDNQSDHLLISFSGLESYKEVPPFNFTKFLSSYHTFDKLFVRDLSRKWYLNGFVNTTKIILIKSDFAHK
jgi:hypothetical protein